MSSKSVDFLRHPKEQSDLTVHTENRVSRGVALSPLRYPGGKRRLALYVAQILSANRCRPKLFVEPFAGGASVALQLLQENRVEKIALGERDPLLASFWKTVFNDHEWLVKKIASIKPTLETWDYYRTAELKSRRERAIACLFLNRTSFSGILNHTAGPIGGRKQESDYSIGCRFAPDRVIKRIETLARLRDKVVFVKQADWKKTIEKVKQLEYKSGGVVFYLDPPFYNKADRLYRYFFNKKNHIALRDSLLKLDENWILSYDAAQEIIDLYEKHGNRQKQIELLYSATGNGRPTGVHELIFTSFKKLPPVTKLWASKSGLN